MKSQHWTLRCGPTGNWDVNKSSILPVPQKHSSTHNYEQHVMINCFIFISFLCCAFYCYFFVLFLLIAKKKFLYKTTCFGTASASASYASCVSSIQGCPQVTNLLYYLVSQRHCDGTATPSYMPFSEHGPIIKQHMAVYIHVCPSTQYISEYYDYIQIAILSLKCALFIILSILG